LTAQLQAVSRDRQRVLHAKVACESRLRAVLETHYPALLHLFSELDRGISLEFIRAYLTPDQARRIKTDRMAAFCARQHYSGRTDLAVLVHRLIPHLLSASEGTTAGKSFSATLFAEELRMLTDHLRSFDSKIDRLLAQDPDASIFLSFPGIGPIVAATLISEMGEDRDRFPCVETRLAETGLGPVTKASGLTRQVRFRYAANRRMRHVIDWWVHVSRAGSSALIMCRCSARLRLFSRGVLYLTAPALPTGRAGRSSAGTVILAMSALLGETEQGSAAGSLGQRTKQ